jgi:hypothetical protein
MPFRTPKPSPQKKKVDLDQPWQAGDSIPAPEAIHGDGDTAWALWHEANQQHEQKFAPTAPMTSPPPVPTTLSPEEQAWAATQPAGALEKALLAPRRREAQPLFTLEGAMLVARRNNRVCPRPERWLEFSAMLPPKKTLRGMMKPPAPITGPAWAATPSLTKRLCFREQIEWAEQAGLLESVMAFMQSMPETDWLHMGED